MDISCFGKYWMRFIGANKLLHFHYQVPNQLYLLKELSNFSYEKKLEQKKIIESLNETTRGCRVQVELQFRPKLASSTHKSFKIPVKEWECYPRFPTDFLSSALNF